MRCTCEWRGGNQMDGLPVMSSLFSPLSFAFSPIVNTSRQHQPAVSICPNSHLENGSQPSALICSKSAMRRGKGNERVCMHACVCVCAHVLRQMM